MHIFLTLLPSLGLLAQLTTAVYTLQDDYGSTNSFFNKFNFYTGPDPTNGYVTYVDKTTAQDDGLISASNGSIFIGVDSRNVASSTGRPSVRLQSINTYTQGLVILDLEHMPSSTCGSWPAFWMLGTSWPNNGEIDIIEGVNTQTSNSMTLHTSDGCTINDNGFTGTLSTGNCYIDAAGQPINAGCGISNPDIYSYGSGFNFIRGGVYATEWTSTGINIWFFPRDSIPLDIIAGIPDPMLWGLPAAKFAGGCDINEHFDEMSIVFDITFCGDWAGSVWYSDSTCSAFAATCNDYVANNPTAFVDTYWSVNSLKVYQDNGLLKRDSVPEYDAQLNSPPQPRRSLQKNRRERW